MITVYLGVRAGSEKYLGSKCLLILNTLIFDNRLPRSVSQGFLIPTRAVVCLTSALEMFLENMKWAEHLHRPGFAFNYESVDFYYFFFKFPKHLRIPLRRRSALLLCKTSEGKMSQK